MAWVSKVNKWQTKGGASQQSGLCGGFTGRGLSLHYECQCHSHLWALHVPAVPRQTSTDTRAPAWKTPQLALYSPDSSTCRNTAQKLLIVILRPFGNNRLLFELYTKQFLKVIALGTKYQIKFHLQNSDSTSGSPLINWN